MVNDLTSRRSVSSRKYLFATISICLLVYAVCWRFPWVMALAGVSHEGVWFLDTFAILAAIDAKRIGLDPYAPNPLNYFGGAHGYSDWWFALKALPIDRKDAVWIGLLVLLLALITAWWVLQPRNKREVMGSVAILCSAPMILALNRANSDLLIFVVLSASIPALISNCRICRLLVSPALVAFAAGLKYYPALAGVIMLGARTVADRLIATLIAAVLLVGVAVAVGPSLFHYTSSRLPSGLHTFGAPILLHQAGLRGPAAAGVSIAFLVGAGGLIVAKFLKPSWRVSVEQERDYRFFIMGAVVLTGSFVATVNYSYRWIFAIWMMPFLCRNMTSGNSGAGIGWLTRVTLGLIVMALWSHACVAIILNSTVHSVAVAEKWIGVFVALEQPFIWSTFACLSAWLCHFLYVQALLPFRERVN